jgi:hypothetical protein
LKTFFGLPKTREEAGKVLPDQTESLKRSEKFRRFKRDGGRGLKTFAGSNAIAGKVLRNLDDFPGARRGSETFSDLPEAWEEGGNGLSRPFSMREEV